jgi:tetratricopeptide (TPR) repeat protein
MSTASSLERIFFECLQKATPEERAAHLAQACAGDAQLLRRLQKMLEAHGSKFLEQAAHVPEPGTDQSGQRIGAYRLVEPIGEGGMGTVWRAEQLEPVQRQVALKLIKAGMDSRQVIARFEAERQALALMDHPNIARVLDGGADAAGRPYFVMDLFAGVPITRYCDERHLPVRERLELFAQVCAAIQHAHQKGVIHRDIKPSNVLVALQDGRAVPKVIDFGIAKAIEQKLGEHTVFTQQGGFLGTLEYMSPEQSARSAGGVDTRSDIYSLGVLLYELLTGSTPLSRQLLDESSLADILRVIAEGETPKPSTRLREKGAATVSGELDWIVMKALEKDRDRRYATAADLGEDVQRFLADQPVMAGPPSALYRLRKLARRRRGALAAACVLVVAVLVAIGGIGWAVGDRAARTADAEHAAADRRARVHAAVDELLAAADEQMAAQAWSEALATARRADAVATSGEADAATAQRVHVLLQDLEFVERLDLVRSRAATWTSSGFDSAAAAREYAGVFREHGIDVESSSVEAMIARLGTTPALALPLAVGLEDLARRSAEAGLDLADCQRFMLVANAIDPDPVRTSIRSIWGKPGLEIARVLVPLARSIDARAQPPATIANLASALRVGLPATSIRLLREAQQAHPGDFWLAFDLGNALGAEKDLRESLRYYTAAVSIRPGSAAAHNNLGYVLLNLHETEAAIASVRCAMELDPKLAMTRVNLCRLLLDQHKPDEALAAVREALELDPRSAIAWIGLGTTLLETKQLQEASDAFQRAIELEPKNVYALGGASDVLRAWKKLPEAIDRARQAIAADSGKAEGYVCLGNALAESGERAAAGEAFRKALDIEPGDAVAHANLANILNSSKEPAERAEAIAHARKSVELNPGYALGYHSLGNALVMDDQDDAALAAWRRAVELAPDLDNAYLMIGLVSWKRGRQDEALIAYRKVVALRPDSSEAWFRIALAHQSRSEWNEAEAALQKAVALEPASVNAQFILAEVLKKLGRYEEAIAAYRRTTELEPRVALRHMLLGLALSERQRYAEAEAAYRRAIELEPKNALPYGVLGDVLHFQRRDDEAALAYRSAIELDPDFGGAHQGLGGILESRGKFAEAIEELEHGVRLGPQVPDAAGDLAMLLANCPDAKLRNGPRAALLARKAIELEPKDPSHSRALGVALYRTGEWQAALAALEAASKRESVHSGFDSFFIAMAHHRLGDEALARAAYERACEWTERTHPDDPDTRRAREEAASLLGHP